MSFNGWTYPLGHFAEGQASRFDMIFPVGSCCDSILEAHLCRDLVAFFVARRRDPQSIRCFSVESSVAIFSQRAIWGGGGVYCYVNFGAEVGRDFRSKG